ncbi:MAG TPA: His/Gly/Thr/Pro-type tRNA ligase C-terminal domain-containing protein, partial [Magnetospirillaceae bacterium]|nr:His/Gly/Thr/Pro-type tRNA ligase C-terminal domain-containing protein [Magnetospirillaceae bacterium]
EQAVIVPIYRTDSKADVIAYAERLKAELKDAGIRVVTDLDDTSTPGWKFAEWELRGVPLRIEAGPRDMEAGKAVLVRRDTGEKIIADAAGIASRVRELLDAVQKNLYDRAKAFRLDNTRDVADDEEMKAFFGKAGDDSESTVSARGGFARALWCGSPECEARLKADIKVTLRCMPLDDQKDVSGACALCNSAARHRAVFARNY